MSGTESPGRHSRSILTSPYTNAEAGDFVFQLITCNLACLAIAALYYTWRDVYMHRRKRENLRERVAYMLWVAASRAA